MYKRHLASFLTKSMAHYPIVTLTGPRQSGKTTLLQQTFPDFAYVSLEDPDMLEFANDDPRGFLDQYSKHVIFDEIQNAPSLFSYLQSKVDKENQNGQFVLSGSQQFALNEKISQTLAGRTALMTLLPLSLSELKGNNPQAFWTEQKLRPEVKKPQESLHEILFSGMYPRLYQNNIPPTKFYRDYVQTYITRDIRQLTHVSDLNKFMTFLRLIAGRCGQRVNLNSLADDTGIDPTTVKRWLSVLETSYIIKLLQPHYRNFSKRLIKASKIHFYDTGLLCYLLHIRNVDELRMHPLIGNIFETFVFSEIFKSFAHLDEEPPIYYWQDQSKREIDILIDQGKSALPIEAKSGQTISKSFFKHLNYWLSLETNPQKNGYIIYGGDQWQQRQNITIMPWFEIS